MEVEREVIPLRDGSVSTLFFVPGKAASAVPDDLVKQMAAVFKHIVDEGQTYPLVDPMTDEEFKEYWMSKCSVILVSGEHTELKPGLKLLGSYYIKPNYPGRASHIANAGFMVDPASRGKGIGKELGKSYLKYGPKAGYKYSVFNLVFETNVASLKTWDALGFDRIGRVPGAAYLKGYEEPVAAIIFGKAFE